MFELLADPWAMHLLIVVAVRARFTNEPSLHGLRFGQALVGDFDAIGMTEKQYRCAKKRLERAGLVRFAGTRQGTVATLSDSRVISLRDERDERGAQFGEQKGERSTEEKAALGADDGADITPDTGRTRGGHGATNTEWQNGQNGEQGGGLSPTQPNASQWPEEITESDIARVTEIAGVSAELVRYAWPIYRAKKLRYGDSFAREGFDGFADFMRSKPGRALYAEMKSRTIAPAAETGAVACGAPNAEELAAERARWRAMAEPEPATLEHAMWLAARKDEA